MEALRITTTGEIYELEDISLESLQEGVGGWVQALALDGLTMWCNEEGKLIGLTHNHTLKNCGISFTELKQIT